VTGVELLAGAAVAYLVRKARRVGGRADAEVDRTLDKGMDALHDLVSRALGQDGALVLLEEQARGGAESERTVRRAADAIAEAAESDAGFAGRLEALVVEMQRREGAAGAGGGSAVASGERSIAVGGDASGIVSTGNNATHTQMKAQASGHGGVYQAGRDQHINDT
jgi:hypothetical protein